MHNLEDAEFLTDAMGYRMALIENELAGHREYRQRNLIEKWFQTLKMRLKRFHTTWMGSKASAQRWLAAFAYYYNYQRPNQALDGRTPAEVVINR